MIRLKTLLEAAWDDKNRPAYWINQHSAQLAAQVGERIDSTLGSGFNGFAFRLVSGKVMKITPDKREVDSAARYKATQRTPHLVGVYDVRPLERAAPSYAAGAQDADEGGLPPDYMLDQNKWWMIIMDYVEPFSQQEKIAWQGIQYYYMNSDYEAKQVEWYCMDGAKTANLPYLETWVQNLMSQRDSVLAAFKRHNIFEVEAHEDNLGWNAQKQLVHYDFWMTQEWLRGRSTRVNQPVRYDASGIDTPGDPTM